MQKKTTHKVLIADESLSCQLLMRVLMKKANLDARIVGSGSAAVDAAISEKFDLILLNTNLPQISGIAAADAIRKKGITTPIIAILSSERNIDLKKCLKISFNGYLQKPITKKPLYEMMAKFLTTTPKLQIPPTEDATTYIDKLPLEVNLDTGRIHTSYHQAVAATGRLSSSSAPSRLHSYAGSTARFSPQRTTGNQPRIQKCPNPAWHAARRQPFYRNPESQ